MPCIVPISHTKDLWVSEVRLRRLGRSEIPICQICLVTPLSPGPYFHSVTIMLVQCAKSLLQGGLAVNLAALGAPQVGPPR